MTRRSTWKRVPITFLERYLKQSRSRLGDDPDQALGDLERSIGDKFAGLQQGGKTPIGMSEVQEVLAEVGGADAVTDLASVSPGQASPGKRRLYRIKEGQWIAGVCTGLAAYGEYRVDWVRTLFLVLAVVTGGGFVLVYVVMMFVLPVVSTLAEYQAIGESPDGVG